MKMTQKAQNQLLKTVARQFRVSVAEMRGRVRKQRVVRARAAVAKMLNEDFRQATILIAHLLNKDSNMGHHYLKLSQDYERDYDWHKRYQQARFESVRDLM